MEEKFVVVGSEHDSWRPVKMKDGTGYTFLHSDGHLMPHRFEDVNEFRNGFAVVETKCDPEYRRMTYVAKNEKVSPRRFTSANDFKDGVAVAYDEYEKFYLNADGTIMQLKNTILDKLIQVPSNSPYMPRIGIKNRFGVMKTYTTIFEKIGNISEGMIPIEMRDSSGQTFMDKQFNILPKRFLKVGRFSNGIAPVVTFDEKCEFVSKQGKVFSHKQIVQAHQELFRCSFEQAQELIDKIYHYNAICEAIRKKQDDDVRYHYDMDKDYDKWVEESLSELDEDDENEI
ncbi:MAG: hypothetical protein E7379_00025 [Clostridiales bacterium]|nr:hypothetical protein [Clostridiales bacterium]